MMRLVALLSCVCLAPLFVHPATAFAEDARAPLSTLELKDGDSIVFLGDSITHQRLYTQYVEDFFYTRFPHMRLKLHNAGVGGAQARDALDRFDADVASYRPKYVTILLGMNDGRYQPFNQEIFETYRTDMTELLSRIEAAGATPILMTPTMYDARAERAKPKPRAAESAMLYNSVLAYYGTWLRDVATERGFGFVDMWGPLNNLTIQRRKSEPAFTMIKDAIHPGADGQVVMAVAIVDDLNLSQQVSSIVLRPGRGGESIVRVKGGAFTDLVWSEDAVSFTWQAESLPWVLPPDAALGGELTRMGHRFGSESLRVNGLPAGRYTLLIDDQDVGTYTSVQLSQRVELQANDKTPQYQQALQVAMLNKQRNEGPIGALRAEWSQFQAYARQKRQLEQDPGNAELKKQVDDREPKIATMAERVDEQNAAARAIEDQIFAANQPPSRKYVLRRAE